MLENICEEDEDQVGGAGTEHQMEELNTQESHIKHTDVKNNKTQRDTGILLKPHNNLNVYHLCNNSVNLKYFYLELH